MPSNRQQEGSALAAVESQEKGTGVRGSGSRTGKNSVARKDGAARKPVEWLVIEIKAPDWEDSACGKDKCWDIGAEERGGRHGGRRSVGLATTSAQQRGDSRTHGAGWRCSMTKTKILRDYISDSRFVHCERGLHLKNAPESS